MRLPAEIRTIIPMVESMIRTGILELVDPLAAQERDRHDEGRERADEGQGLHEAPERIVDEGAVEADPRDLGMSRHDADQGHPDEPDREFGHEVGRLLALDGADHQQNQSPDPKDEFGEEQREGIAGGHRQSCEGAEAAAAPRSTVDEAPPSEAVAAERGAADAAKVFIMPSTVAWEESRIGCG